MTADVTREPTGGQELREAAARWLFHKVTRRDGLTKLQWEHLHYEEQQTGWLGWADELLTDVPELAALIADAERVRRVRRLVEAWEGKGESTWRQFRRALVHDYDSLIYARILRRALDGEPQP